MDELIVNTERVTLLINYICHLFVAIRGDWADPRYECREGWDACAHLERELGTGKYEPSEPDESYFGRIKETLAEAAGGAA
jgi:hypothetical protein